MGEKRAKTSKSGQFSFPSLPSGKYQVRVMAKGFAVVQRKNIAIDRATVFDTQFLHTFKGQLGRPEFGNNHRIAGSGQTA